MRLVEVIDIHGFRIGVIDRDVPAPTCKQCGERDHRHVVLRIDSEVAVSYHAVCRGCVYQKRWPYLSIDAVEGECGFREPVLSAGRTPPGRRWAHA